MESPPEKAYFKWGKAWLRRSLSIRENMLGTPQNTVTFSSARINNTSLGINLSKIVILHPRYRGSKTLVAQPKL
ncbi:MAG: hypothetical protein BWY80_00908 [Firmicutes bacterium ADurb.Bin456]|nr:MAG: hypothetical protein BWY80_00908 [Firmicutes bacterium ADurb.Bin456]